jgi:hypothetical protein
MVVRLPIKPESATTRANCQVPRNRPPQPILEGRLALKAKALPRPADVHPSAQLRTRLAPRLAVCPELIEGLGLAVSQTMRPWKPVRRAMVSSSSLMLILRLCSGRVSNALPMLALSPVEGLTGSLWS